MAHWVTACEWCGKSMDFMTEDKKGDLHKCDKCNDKKDKAIMNDCYPQIRKSLERGMWVLAEREVIDFNGTPEKDFIVFTFLSSKGYIRGTHSRDSIKGALDDLFAQVWNQEDINKFGFIKLTEVEPITHH